ncbi:MAG: His/Gly/Thr/Pro-type tRNA ligase C-terminal domain-containing protein [Candidatus Portnoybacteria bacterium]|nr:His/Gly/Thr/Pro-type tRNA ligase C-terminal domain-containing protein [Candidatus Portnoybacteria bacterium]
MKVKGAREEIASKISHRFLVLTPTGEEIPIDLDMVEKNEKMASEFPELMKVIDFEVLGKKPGMAPPSIKLMKEKELIDYEPASDSGHFRFYPKGALILKLLEDWADEIARRYGAMQIETPILYDWKHKAIRSQAESFHERHYSVRVPNHPKKEFVLRFAGDFGLFCMMKDANFSHHQLPLKIYEYSKSYRYERSGELVGLRRLRGFSMPDIHTFCEDITQSWIEYGNLYRHYSDLAAATQVEYAIIFRAVEEFYSRHKNEILMLLRYSRRPAIIELLSGMKHYWAVKHEFQGIDSVGGSCQVATVQLDVKDAETYGITFVNQRGEKKGCIICHSSIGALERWIFLMLETALKAKIPALPLWISPSQIRIIPVSDSFLEFAIETAKGLNANRIRSEIDDRPNRMGYKIMLAEKDWIPYILVLGKEEQSSGYLSIRKRGHKATYKTTLKQLVMDINLKTEKMPFRQSTLPVLMSKRPVFYG